jgi:CRP-like cAMP-binding protein
LKEPTANAARARLSRKRRLKSKRETIGNNLLTLMEPKDFALLQPHLSIVDLPVRRQLETRNRAVEHVYFLRRGLASIVVSVGANRSIEVAVIGREGMTGLSVLLEADRSLPETFIQSPGDGWRIAAEELRQAMNQSASLRAFLLRYVHVLVGQMTFTTLANGRYKLEERLARWLLMAQDRSDDSMVTLTHEFLALMLGVRRPGVTAALNGFEKRDFIQTRRGAILIRDRKALEEAANGSYGGPEAEYERVFGEVPA